MGISKLKILQFVLLVFYSCQKQDKSLKITFTGQVSLDELENQHDSLLSGTYIALPVRDYLVINLEIPSERPMDQKAEDALIATASTKIALLKKSGVSHAFAHHAANDKTVTSENGYFSSLQQQGIEPIVTNLEPTIMQSGPNSCAVIAASIGPEGTSNTTIEALKASVSIFHAKRNNSPLVLMLYWGKPEQHKAQNWQRQLARELVAQGANAIIGYHPTVSQTMEYIGAVPVFYSLGPFAGESKTHGSVDAYALQLTVTKQIQRIELIPMQKSPCVAQITDSNTQALQLERRFIDAETALLEHKNAWELKSPDAVTFNEPVGSWLFASCKTISRIKKLGHQSYLLRFKKADQNPASINLYGQLHQFCISDINHDQNTDILLNISKKVKFDTSPTLSSSKIRKR